MDIEKREELDYKAFENLIKEKGNKTIPHKTEQYAKYDCWTEKDGKTFAAKVVSHKNGQLTLDITAAYPKEAAVNSWKRTVSARTTGISVVEEYELDACREPVRLMLMALSPKALEHLKYDRKQLEATVEDISDKLDPVLQKMWGPQMYRIVLTVKSTRLKNQVRYTIQ